MSSSHLPAFLFVVGVLLNRAASSDASSVASIDSPHEASSPAGDGQQFGVFTEQGGRRFFGSEASTEGSSVAWSRSEFNGLSAADFVAWDGGPGPDFSSTGDSITFGCYTETSSSARAVSTTDLFDNVFLRVNP